MKMLMFDFRESERAFFENNELKDFDIEFFSKPLTENTVLTEEQFEETDIISVFITSSLNENILKKFKNLRIIATRSTGYNHIDLKYCKQNRIAVFNVAGYGENAVAQYTFLLILALIRNLKPAYLDIKRESISYELFEGHNLSALALGIIGCGSIGSAVAKIANFFGMKVYVYSLTKNSCLSNMVEFVSYEELLEKSDIITLHIPYDSAYKHMINKASFEKMKKGVYIINTARGELIDSTALYEGLKKGKVKGVALDVFECEKYIIDDNMLLNTKEFDKECVSRALIIQKLLNFDNVIITPHIAYNTQESIDKILEVTFNNIRDFCKGLHTNQIY